MENSTLYLSDFGGGIIRVSRANIESKYPILTSGYYLACDYIHINAKYVIKRHMYRDSPLEFNNTRD